MNFILFHIIMVMFVRNTMARVYELPIVRDDQIDCSKIDNCYDCVLAKCAFNKGTGRCSGRGETKVPQDIDAIFFSQ